MLNRKIALPAALLFLLISPALAQQKKAPPPEPKIKVGDMAPDFTMDDQSGKPVSLHEFKGKKSVALAFVIFAFTGG